MDVMRENSKVDDNIESEYVVLIRYLSIFVLVQNTLHSTNKR